MLSNVHLLQFAVDFYGQGNLTEGEGSVKLTSSLNKCINNLFKIKRVVLN